MVDKNDDIVVCALLSYPFVRLFTILNCENFLYGSDVVKQRKIFEVVIGIRKNFSSESKMESESGRVMESKNATPLITTRDLYAIGKKRIPRYVFIRTVKNIIHSFFIYILLQICILCESVHKLTFVNDTQNSNSQRSLGLYMYYN